MRDLERSKNTGIQAYPLINIRGGLVHLYEFISSQIIRSMEEGQIVIFVTNYSAQIQRYLKSIEIVRADYTYAGLEYSLEQNRFDFVTKIENVGEYTRRGDIVSFWPIGYAHPIRIEFFDEKIEKMYEYDQLYGTKLDEVESVVIGDSGSIDEKVEFANIAIMRKMSLPDLPLQESYVHEQSKDPVVRILDNEQIKKILGVFDGSLGIVVFGQLDQTRQDEIDLSMGYPPLLYKRFDLFVKIIEDYEKKGYSVSITSAKANQIPQSFRRYLVSGLGALSAGYENRNKKEVVFTDRELFGTLFLSQEKAKRLNSKEAKKILDQLESDVEIGDYLVHEDHGIGVYQGIAQEGGQEYLSLKYAQEDELLVPFNQLHKITKYIGVSSLEPEITTLDKISWQKIAKNARKSVQILARDLAGHYAKIALSKAPPVPFVESDKYKEFVNDFGYEETEDQKNTIAEIFEDLNSTEPTNRLIVGDVGFGKTEVVLRASFVAVEKGLQVALLCPTTVLAMQHYKVFASRLEKFGIKVEMLSRFAGSKKNKDVVEKLNKGEIDIVVGTHRLLSNDVKFDRLGLVILDEEQRFGVSQKEKIRKVKYGAHVISMTATPIPRTLSMALSQIQDISIISTPPKGRRSVKTYVEKEDWDKIREAIRREVERGGQVYFLHNEVRTIESTKSRLQRLLPNVRFVVGHGQMNESKLEQNINDFYERKYDCLVCTTIIENGIDMPNVNTIIIENAQNFGLGQLYQLRGRVGRSDKQAFAYLFYKGLGLDEQNNVPKNEAEGAKETPSKQAPVAQNHKKYIERLKAVLENQELGSGFKIASRDLEIRGAGNLLGKEQHGNISKVGLALYMQLLAQEIERLKHQQTAVS